MSDTFTALGMASMTDQMREDMIKELDKPIHPLDYTYKGLWEMADDWANSKKKLLLL